MAASGGDFERPLGAFLALDVAQIAVVRWGGDLARFSRGKRALPGEVADHVAQRRRCNDLRIANPCGLGP